MTIATSMKIDKLAPIMEALIELLSRFEAKSLAPELRQRRWAADRKLRRALDGDIRSGKEDV